MGFWIKLIDIISFSWLRAPSLNIASTLMTIYLLLHPLYSLIPFYIPSHSRICSILWSYFLFFHLALVSNQSFRNPKPICWDECSGTRKSTGNKDRISLAIISLCKSYSFLSLLSFLIENLNYPREAIFYVGDTTDKGETRYHFWEFEDILSVQLKKHSKECL